MIVANTVPRVEFIANGPLRLRRRRVPLLACPAVPSDHASLGGLVYVRRQQRIDSRQAGVGAILVVCRVS